MADAVMQDLEKHYDKPNLLYRDLREWVENGFARFSEPLLDRLFQIEGPSERYKHARDVISEQLQNSPPAGNLRPT